MPISLVLDIIIAVLLVLTIAYAMRLNQRLSQLRSDKNELLQLAKTFAEATARAEDGIHNLKISSEALQAEVKKAETLKDDLSYLVDRGGRTADEMVANVGKPSSGRSAPQRDADAEARLIQDAIRQAAPQAGQRGAPARQPERTGSHLDGALTRRVSARPAGPGARAIGGALASRGLGGMNADDAIEDTEAARELLKALSAVK